jgi:hypothetical protein
MANVMKNKANITLNKILKPETWVWGRTETNKKCLEEKQRKLERVLLGFEKFEVWMSVWKREG